MELTQSFLKEMLTYDPLTGVFLWNKNGCVAGPKPHRGAKIRVGGRSYLKHRLAWLYVYGDMPSGDIDHINCDPTDNSIANLRLATRSQNLANQKIHRNNSTGFKGVVPSRDRFRAHVYVNGKRIHAGVFDTPEEAHAAYAAKACEIYGEFARVA